MDPLRKYLIFSVFRKNITSLSHSDSLGGIGDFHSKRILLLAINVANAKAFSLSLVM